MAKTFTNLTVANATAGNAVLASDHATNFQNVNNLMVPPMVRAYRSTSAFSITPGAGAYIDWNNETIDTDTMHDNNTNPSRLTVQTAGVYLVNTVVTIDFTGTSTLRQAKLTHTTSNGGTTTGFSVAYDAYSLGSVAVVSMTGMYEAAVGDYFRVSLEANSGGSATTVRASPDCFFQAAFVGKTS